MKEKANTPQLHCAAVIALIDDLDKAQRMLTRHAVGRGERLI